MLSNRELQVLRLRPAERMCYKCLARFTSASSAEADLRIGASQGTVRYRLGACSGCRQFLHTFEYIPPEKPQRRASGSA